MAGGLLTRQVVSWDGPFLLRSFELPFLPGGGSVSAPGPWCQEQRRGAPSTATVVHSLALAPSLQGRGGGVGWLCAERQVLAGRLEECARKAGSEVPVLGSNPSPATC